jgi:hypothetical protein
MIPDSEGLVEYFEVKVLRMDCRLQSRGMEKLWIR